MFYIIPFTYFINPVAFINGARSLVQKSREVDAPKILLTIAVIFAYCNLIKVIFIFLWLAA